MLQCGWCCIITIPPIQLTYMHKVCKSGKSVRCRWCIAALMASNQPVLLRTNSIIHQLHHLQGLNISHDIVAITNVKQGKVLLWKTLDVRTEVNKHKKVEITTLNKTNLIQKDGGEKRPEEYTPSFAHTWGYNGTDVGYSSCLSPPSSFCTRLFFFCVKSPSSFRSFFTSIPTCKGLAAKYFHYFLLFSVCLRHKTLQRLATPNRHNRTV